MGPKKDAWTAAGPPAVHVAVLPATELRHGHTCNKPVTIPAGTRTRPVRKGKMGLFKHKQCCLIKTTVSLLDKPIPKTEGQELPASEVRWKHLTLTAPTPENMLTTPPRYSQKLLSSNPKIAVVMLSITQLPHMPAFFIFNSSIEREFTYHTIH